MTEVLIIDHDLLAKGNAISVQPLLKIHKLEDGQLRASYTGINASNFIGSALFLLVAICSILTAVVILTEFLRNLDSPKLLGLSFIAACLIVFLVCLYGLYLGMKKLLERWSFNIRGDTFDLTLHDRWITDRIVGRTREILPVRVFPSGIDHMRPDTHHVVIEFRRDDCPPLRLFTSANMMECKAFRDKLRHCIAIDSHGSKR